MAPPTGWGTRGGCGAQENAWLDAECAVWAAGSCRGCAPSTGAPGSCCLGDRGGRRPGCKTRPRVPSLLSLLRARREGWPADPRASSSFFWPIGQPALPVSALTPALLGRVTGSTGTPPPASLTLGKAEWPWLFWAHWVETHGPIGTFVSLCPTAAICPVLGQCDSRSGRRDRRPFSLHGCVLALCPDCGWQRGRPCQLALSEPVAFS